MTQVTITTNDLVLKALRLINIAPPDLSTDQNKITEGIDSLNMLLDSYQSAGVVIPFRQDFSFTMPQNTTEFYFGYTNNLNKVSDQTLIQLDYVLLYDNAVPYPVQILDISQYKREQLVKTYIGRPNVVKFQRSNEYSYLSFLHTPQQNYQITITGKFALNKVEKYQELSGLPPYARRFLTYAIARELQSIYRSGVWTQKEEDEYRLMYDDMRATNDYDLDSRAPNAFNVGNWIFDGWWYNGY